MAAARTAAARHDVAVRAVSDPRGLTLAKVDTADPWRLFFPLGVAIAWAGVLHWLAFALGASDRYRAVFHATAQIQGFLTAIAVGFLFTFVPRRTATAPPSPAEVVAAAAAPVATTIAAWLERWALAEALWAAGVLVVAAFVIRRVRAQRGAQRVPAVFVWVPVALVSGRAGAAIVAVAAVLGPHEEPQLWQLGRGLVLQGFVSALVVGVGGTMLPTLTRGAADPALAAGARASPGVHGAAALLFLASGPVEVYADARAGFALRAAVAGVVLVATARLWRPPSAPGLHRRLIWVSAWLLPVGYAVVALVPSLRSTALHVVFIGSFALMALSVSLHVALSHGGRPDRLAGRPWQVWALAILVLAAVVFRFLAGAQPAHLGLWLAHAASSFLLATAAWAALVLPAIAAAGRRRRG